MKTILHINSYYSNSTFYTDFYNAFENSDYSNLVYVPIQKKYKIPNYNIIGKLTFSQIYTKIDRIFFFPKIFKILRDIEKTYDLSKIDLIHSHSLFANGMPAYHISKKYKIPMLTAIRNTDYNFFIKKIPFFRRIAEKIIRQSKRVIFISPAYYKKIFVFFGGKAEKLISKKSVVIPNGINSFWHKNQNNVSNKIVFDKHINIIQIGNIVKNKNIINSLKAVEYLNIQQLLDCSITFIGKIRSKSIYKKINNNPFASYVDFLSKEKLINVYKNHEIFLLPSYNETFGLVYIEALSQGIPIIYSKNEGVDGFFDNENVGEKVNPKSPLSLANAILKIVEDYSQYKWDNASLLKRFDWDCITKKYIKIYKDFF